MYFDCSPDCGDAEVYKGVCQYTVTSLLGVVTGARDHNQMFLTGLMSLCLSIDMSWRLILTREWVKLSENIKHYILNISL